MLGRDSGYRDVWWLRRGPKCFKFVSAYIRVIRVMLLDQWAPVKVFGFLDLQYASVSCLKNRAAGQLIRLQRCWLPGPTVHFSFIVCMQYRDARQGIRLEMSDVFGELHFMFVPACIRLILPGQWALVKACGFLKLLQLQCYACRVAGMSISLQRCLVDLWSSSMLQFHAHL